MPRAVHHQHDSPVLVWQDFKEDSKTPEKAATVKRKGQVLNSSEASKYNPALEGQGCCISKDSVTTGQTE